MHIVKYVIKSYDANDFWTGADWVPVVDEAIHFSTLTDAMTARYTAKASSSVVSEIWADWGTKLARKVMP